MKKVTEKQRISRIKNLSKRKSFVKGDPRINRKGTVVKRNRHGAAWSRLMRTLDKELKIKKAVTANQIEELLFRFYTLTEKELESIANDVDLPLTSRDTAKFILNNGYSYTKQLLENIVQNKIAENLPKTQFIIVTTEDNDSDKNEIIDIKDPDDEEEED